MLGDPTSLIAGVPLKVRVAEVKVSQAGMPLAFQVRVSLSASLKETMGTASLALGFVSPFLLSQLL
jgi:hypothetical protein